MTNPRHFLLADQGGSPPGVDPPRKQCSTRIRFSDVSAGIFTCSKAVLDEDFTMACPSFSTASFSGSETTVFDTLHLHQSPKTLHFRISETLSQMSFLSTKSTSFQSISHFLHFRRKCATCSFQSPRQVLDLDHVNKPILLQHFKRYARHGSVRTASELLDCNRKC